MDEVKGVESGTFKIKVKVFSLLMENEHGV